MDSFCASGVEVYVGKSTGFYTFLFSCAFFIIIIIIIVCFFFFFFFLGGGGITSAILSYQRFLQLPLNLGCVR